MKGTFNKNKHPRLLLLFTVLCVSFLGILSVAVPPGADPDPCRGFLVMQCMEHGGGFNLLISPDPQNILKDRALFLAWWSPGQYLFPYFFKILLKINTGRAAALTVSVCSVLGLAGFFKLFIRLGFTHWIAAVSVAFIASQLFFIAPFVYYPGGEVLLFAFMGWFLYGCISFERITWEVFVFSFFSLLIGFFSKSSVLWIYAAGMACLWINISLSETALLFSAPAKANPFLISAPRIKKETIIWLINGIMLTVPAIASLSVIYFFYISKGPNPSDSSGHFLIKPETFCFPLASPIVSGFSVDEWLDGLIYHPEGLQLITYHIAVFIICVLAFCSLGLVVLMVRYSPGKKYTLTLLTFYVLGTLFFSYLFLKQATVTYEGRHFRIIGLLATPGIIYLLFKTKITRVLFFLAWFALAGMGVNFFVDEFNGNREAPRGNTGLSQQGYDGAALKEITKIDSHSRKAVFVVTSPDLALEIIHNRVIIIEVENLTHKALSKLKYAGYGGQLFLLMPIEYVVGGKSTIIIKSFTNYHNFKAKRLSDNYYLYSGDK